MNGTAEDKDKDKDKDTVSSEDAGEVWRCVDCKKDFKDINNNNNNNDRLTAFDPGQPG